MPAGYPKQPRTKPPGVPKGTIIVKPGLIPHLKLAKTDALGGNTYEDHYRRWLFQDAIECNKLMRKAMLGGKN